MCVRERKYLVYNCRICGWKKIISITGDRFAKGEYSYVVISLETKGYVWDGLTVYKEAETFSYTP